MTASREPSQVKLAESECTAVCEHTTNRVPRDEAATLREAELGAIASARMDATISTLVSMTASIERIFTSPVPLIYSRLTSRFLSAFLVLLPLALWSSLSVTWYQT